MSRQTTDEVIVEVDGPGIEPDTVDSLLMMRLATACFQLISKVADDLQAPITLRGLAVHDGCVGVGAVPNNDRAASLALARSAKIIAGLFQAPKGAGGELDEVVRCLRGLPRGASASFCFHDSDYPLVAPELPNAESPWEVTELRVTPIRVGGKDLKVAFASESENTPFALDVGIENARKLGALLQSEVDVAIEIHRGVDGNIEGGRVLDVFELADGGSEAWRQWFEQVGDGWDLVEDIGVELGRH